MYYQIMKCKNYLQQATGTCEAVNSRDNVISAAFTESYKLNSLSNPLLDFCLPVTDKTGWGDNYGLLNHRLPIKPLTKKSI